ncbi:MAG: domain containing protein [Betaproteobacteria bacterium]|nr:domain containing protein [Betaproteobacteria bacterium]
MKLNFKAALISVALLAGPTMPGAVYSGDLLKANGVSTLDDAKKYYSTIDPNDLRLTQAAWRAVNGFDEPGNEVVVVGGHKNVSDLGFWRRIEMVIDKRPGYVGNVAFTTFNFETEQDAFVNVHPLSIVNMEYSPGPNGDRITKFYIYDAAGNRQTKTFFDPAAIHGAREDLYLPNGCAACHGGGTHGVDFRTHAGRTGGGFLAFDFNVFEYGVLTSRADNEANVKKLNQGVLMTNPPSAVKTLVSGLYGGNNLPRATQNSAYRPSDWNTEPALWKVVVTDCLGCHTLTEQEVLSLDHWKRNVASFRQIILKEKEMPNAPFSNRRFWNTNNHQIVEDALNRFRH